MQIVRDFGTFSPTWDAFINPPPQELRKLCGEGGRKSVGAELWKTPKKQGLLNTAGQTDELTESEAECTGHTQVHPRWDPNTVSGKWIQVLIPNQEAISNRQLIAKGNFIFSNGISLGIQAMLKSRWLTQNEFKGSVVVVVI